MQVATIGALMLAPAAVAQTPPPEAATTPPPAEAVSEPAAAEVAPPSLRPEKIYLLREGSRLVKARGTMIRDRATRTWRFVIKDPPTAMRYYEPAGGYELTLLPCRLLEDMEHLVREMTEHRATFEMTGEVYVYGRRNFLLPTHTPLIVELEVRPEPAAPEPATAAEGDGDDSVDDIMRDLERSVGALPRRMAAGPRRTTELPSTIVPEGTVLTRRRGKLARTPEGAWQFIFDADAEGLAEPPMIVLPCQLLMDMERIPRQGDPQAALLVSGTVYTYDNRNFLMPSLYEIARERTVLRP